MAAVPVTIVGILTTDTGSTNATMVGMASLTGVGVGGGPVLPPGSLPHPEHPIVIPPGKPEVPPPGIWPGPGDPDFPAGPHPEHPIVLPPNNPVIPPGTLVTWKAVWSEQTGWMVIGVPNVPHPAPG